MKLFYYLIPLIVMTLATISGAQIYPGTTYLYIIFSILSFLMLGICLFQKQYLTLTYLGFFLWMGFWLKTFLFFHTQKPFVEPVGLFNFTSGSWDEVLTAATIGICGFIFSLLIFLSLRNKNKNLSHNELIKISSVPIFYQKNRSLIYLISFILALSIPFFNIKFGIHQVGLNPKTIMQWPFNALIAFSINIGLMLVFSNFLFWDSKNKRKIYLGMLLIIVTAFAASVSTLSRGMYVLQLVPFFAAIIIYKEFKIKELSILLLTFSLFFILSISITGILRNNLYPNVSGVMTSGQEYLIRLEVLEGGIDHAKKLIKNGEKQEKHLALLEEEKKQLLEKIKSYKIKKTKTEPQNIKIDHLEKNLTTSNNIDSVSEIKITSSELSYQLKTGAIKNILSLATSRFIGVEGLMAMQAYESKGWDIFLKALFEKRTLKNPTMYQDVAKSTYRYTDMTEWQFASLPGAMAFLYYSSSLIWVFIGMFLFGVILILIEKLVFTLSLGNIFLTSLISCVFSSSVAQFGITPRQDLPYYGMILLVVVISWFLTKFLNRKLI